MENFFAIKLNDYLYICDTIDDAGSLVKQHEIKTTTKFCRHCQISGFFTTDPFAKLMAEEIHKKRIYWLPNNVPYMKHGIVYMECHQGRSRKSQHKEDGKAEHNNNFKKKRRSLQESKKVNCPAKIVMKEIAYFPQYQEEELTAFKQRKLSAKLKKEIIGSTYEWGLLVSLPEISEHKNHQVTQEEGGNRQPLDKAVIKRIRELTHSGIRKLSELKERLDLFVVNELFAGYDQLPAKSNTRFYPTDKIIYNHVQEALREKKNSNIEQEIVSFNPWGDIITGRSEPEPEHAEGMNTGEHKLEQITTIEQNEARSEDKAERANTLRSFLQEGHVIAINQREVSPELDAKESDGADTSETESICSYELEQITASVQEEIRSEQNAHRSPASRIVQNNVVKYFEEKVNEYLYICGTSKDAAALIDQHEVKTTTKFVRHARSRGFFEKDPIERLTVPELQMKRIYWLPNNMPYVKLGSEYLNCHRGPHRRPPRTEQHHQAATVKHSDTAKRKRMISKKVSCPARITVKEIMYFPQCQLKEATQYGRRIASKQIKAHIASSAYKWKLLVKLPDISSHKNHQVKQEAGSSQPLDKDIRKRIRDLTNEGIRSIPEMKKRLEQFVINELFAFTEPPAKSNRRFYPTDKIIKNHMLFALKGQNISTRNQIKRQPRKKKEKLSTKHTVKLSTKHTVAANEKVISTEDTVAATEIISTEDTVAANEIISTEDTVAANAIISTEDAVAANEIISTENTVAAKEIISTVEMISSNELISSDQYVFSPGCNLDEYIVVVDDDDRMDFEGVKVYGSYS